MPSMLKGDQPVQCDWRRPRLRRLGLKATYTGKAKLWQADTSINAQTLTIDSKDGDLTASGSVATSAMLEQGTKNAKAKERVRTMGGERFRVRRVDAASDLHEGRAPDRPAGGHDCRENRGYASSRLVTQLIAWKPTRS